MSDSTTKRGRGRPPINGVAMTQVERRKRYEAKRKAAGAPTRGQVLQALRNENVRLREIAGIGRQLLGWYTRSSGKHVVGSMMPLGLHDPSEVSWTWERLHKLIVGGGK